MSEASHSYTPPKYADKHFAKCDHTYVYLHNGQIKCRNAKCGRVFILVEPEEMGSD